MKQRWQSTHSPQIPRSNLTNLGAKSETMPRPGRVRLAANSHNAQRRRTGTSD